VRKAITPKTRLIALTHASNVVGTIQPIAEVGSIARERNVLFLVDAAQTAGVVPIDVQTANIDLLAFPDTNRARSDRHRCALRRAAGQGRRLARSGTGGDSSSETQPREFPYFLEGGTPNVLGVAGLAAGIKYVQERGIKGIHDQEVELTSGCGGGSMRSAVITSTAIAT